MERVVEESRKRRQKWREEADLREEERTKARDRSRKRRKDEREAREEEYERELQDRRRRRDEQEDLSEEERIKARDERTKKREDERKAREEEYETERESVVQEKKDVDEKDLKTKALDLLLSEGERLADKAKELLANDFDIQSANGMDTTKPGSTCLPIGVERQQHQRAYTTEFRPITARPIRVHSGFFPAPDPIREGWKHHDIYLHKLGKLDPLDDTKDRRVWELRDFLRDRHPLSHEIPQSLIERCCDLPKTPHLTITLHTESFVDAIACLRSELFFPNILKPCIRYLRLEYKHHELLRKGIEESDRFAFESRTKASLIQGVREVGTMLEPDKGS